MVGGGPGAAAASQASELQTNLFKQYGQTGLPALSGALNYTRGALGQGMPSYVQSAYAQARAGAQDSQVQGLTSLQNQIASRESAGRNGGAYLGALSNAAGTAGDAYLGEMSGIRTSQAVAGITQRNKLLGLLAGGSATGTNLSAAFGSLGNKALGLDVGANPTFGYVTGGASAALGLYGALNTNPGQTNLGFQQGINGIGAGVGANVTIPQSTTP